MNEQATEQATERKVDITKRLQQLAEYKVKLERELVGVDARLDELRILLTPTIIETEIPSGEDGVAELIN